MSELLFTFTLPRNGDDRRQPPARKAPDAADLPFMNIGRYSRGMRIAGRLAAMFCAVMALWML